MDVIADETTPMKPDYGIDAPGVVRNLFLVATVGVLPFLGARFGWWPGVVAHVDLALPGICAGIGCAFMGCWMLYDSKIGKLKERERLLDLVPWRGSETVLDLGCGRGLLLVAAARRLSTGKATGPTCGRRRISLATSPTRLWRMHGAKGSRNGWR